MQAFEALHVLAATVTFGAVHVAPGQSPALLHCTQVLPPVLQSGVAGSAAQSAVILHCTHVLPPVLQRGVAGIDAQFAFVTHCTQVSVVRLQPCVPVQPAAGTAALLTQTSHLSLSAPPFWSQRNPGAHWAGIVHDVLQALFVHEKFGAQAVGAGVGHV